MDNLKSQETNYANEMNTIAFTGFKEQELNMFFALITYMKDRGTKRTVISYSELKKMMGLGNTHVTNKEFTKTIIAMWNKLNKLNYCIQEETTFAPFVLFATFLLDDIERHIIIAVNPDFAFMLNKPEKYTYFRLERFISIKNKYAKLLYTHLCQFRKTGIYKVKIDEFKRLLYIVQISFLLGHEQLETTMIYLDITTEDEREALSTLEYEKDKNVSKKWKNMDGSLVDFCGIK